MIEAPLARENWGERERESVMCARSLFVLFVLFLVKKKTDARGVRKIFKTLGGGALVLTNAQKFQRIKASLSVLQSKYVAFAAVPVARSLSNGWPLKRIAHPLVPGTLFPASSISTRCARNIARERCIASSQDVLSRLRLSI